MLKMMPLQIEGKQARMNATFFTVVFYEIGIRRKPGIIRKLAVSEGSFAIGSLCVPNIGLP
jgi:hypothetical protein